MDLMKDNCTRKVATELTNEFNHQDEKFHATLRRKISSNLRTSKQTATTINTRRRHTLKISIYQSAPFIVLQNGNFN